MMANFVNFLFPLSGSKTFCSQNDVVVSYSFIIDLFLSRFIFMTFFMFCFSLQASMKDLTCS